MRKVFKICCLLFILLLNIKIVDAASFTINASTNLTKGGSTKLTIKGIDVTGRFNITTSNAGVISVSEGSAWIENNSYTIKLSAINVGTATITVTPIKPSDSNGNAVSLGSKSIKITVSNPREKSSDNNLASLSVEGATITPTFDKNTLEYSTEVSENVKTIKINARASSVYATVTGAGSKEVKEGDNHFDIVVKSETGSVKTYKLNVTVKDNNPIIVSVDDKNYTVVKIRENYPCNDLFTESVVTINEFNVPACYNETLKYTLVGLKDETGSIKSFIYEDNNYKPYNDVKGTSLMLLVSDVLEKKGMTITDITIDDVSYKAYKYNDSDRFYIVNGENIENGEKGYYLFDSKEKVFMLYEMNEKKEEVKTDKENIYKYIAIIFGVGLFLSLIGLIMLFKKNNNNHKKEKTIIEEDNKKEEKKSNEKKKKEEVKEEKEKKDKSKVKKEK